MFCAFYNLYNKNERMILKDEKTNEGKKRLLALVVTIIILLILAGITVAALTGDNGLIQNAGNAKNTNEKGQIEEQIRLAYNEWKLQNETGETVKLKDVIENMLKQSYNDDEFTVTEELNEKTIYVIFKDDQFTVLDDGRIIPGKIAYLNIKNGTINIDKDGYVQGTNAKNPHTGKYVITGESNENTVNIMGEGEYDIVLDNLEINVYDKGLCAFDANKELTATGCFVNLALQGDNILKSGLGVAGLQFKRCRCKHKWKKGWINFEDRWRWKFVCFTEAVE